MKHGFMLILPAALAIGALAFADDFSGSRCADSGRVTCYDQSAPQVATSNPAAQYQQSQQYQAYRQPAYESTPVTTYQPSYNYLNYPQQNMQTVTQTYTSALSTVNNLEQQRAAVSAINQSQFSFGRQTVPDFSSYNSFANNDFEENPKELARKIKSAAQPR